MARTKATTVAFADAGIGDGSMALKNYIGSSRDLANMTALANKLYKDSAATSRYTTQYPTKNARAPFARDLSGLNKPGAKISKKRQEYEKA